MKIAVVGGGRVGTCVGVLLTRAGHKVVAVSGRGPTRDRALRFLPEARVLEPAAAAREGELVFVGMPDDLIADTVASIASQNAFREGQFVAHGSGALGLDVLTSARELGARRLGIHPLQAIPDVGHGLDRIPGCAIAVAADDDEGFRVAERIADDLGGEPFHLDEAMRPLYHAAAVLASNDLVVLAAAASELFATAGVPDPARAMRALQTATLENIADLGPAPALTGPAVRGDAGTVERNLGALRAHAPDTVPAYLALTRLALRFAADNGRLTPAGRDAVEAVLLRWS
jgi:predicted short-subunit dehydrogenase-like oxidoreductase (DUF2520 family)